MADKLFEVRMGGGEPVIFRHREEPEFFDKDGKPRQVVKPAEGLVLVRAGSPDEARAIAQALNPEYPKVTSVKER